jgi:hypothetical protein
LSLIAEYQIKNISPMPTMENGVGVVTVSGYLQNFTSFKTENLVAHPLCPSQISQ